MTKEELEELEFLIRTGVSKEEPLAVYTDNDKQIVGFYYGTIVQYVRFMYLTGKKEEHDKVQEAVSICKQIAGVISDAVNMDSSYTFKQLVEKVISLNEILEELQS